MTNFKLCDFHSHTTCSDGALSPRELIERAARNKVTYFSITDHDTVLAYEANLFEYATSLGVTLIPGVEISTRDESGQKYHIVGLNIDITNKTMLLEFHKISISRKKYVEDVSKKLHVAGFAVDTTSLLAVEGSVTKAQLAKQLVSNAVNKDILVLQFGRVPSYGEFIERYMLPGQSAFVAQEGVIHPRDAISLIHVTGGIAILAHPEHYVRKGKDRQEMLQELKSWGVDGIECYAAEYGFVEGVSVMDFVVDEYSVFCDQNNLLVSGGSDFHEVREVFADVGLVNTSYKLHSDLLSGILSRLQNKH